MRRIRGAARALSPAVVDLGPGQPRLAAYLEAVEGRGERAALRLSPIAAEAIPEPPPAVIVRLVAADGEASFALFGQRIERLGGSTARVPLARARLEHLPPRPRARLSVAGTDPLMLLAPGGLGDSEVHVLPIVDLANAACQVETSLPLEPGRRIEPVEIVGDRGVLRTARAVVQEAIAWRSPHGDPRFRCRIHLEPAEIDSSARVYDLVTDPDRVRQVVELGVMTRTRGWYETPSGSRGRFRFAGRGDAAVSLSLEPRLVERGPSPRRLRLGIELFTVSYEMDVRPLQRRGDRLEASLPLLLRRRRRRQERRVAVPVGQDVRVRFVNPVTARQEVRRVRDLSFGGLAFEADEARDVLWKGLSLEDAVLRWGDREIGLGELELCELAPDEQGRGVGHAAVRSAAVRNDRDLIELLARFKHPELEVHEGESFARMLDAYRREHVIYGYMEELLPRVEGVAADNWRRLHRREASLARTLLHRRAGVIDSNLTAIAAWEHGWFVQHFGTCARDGFRWSGELQMAAVDHVMLRPDARFLFFVVNEKNTSMRRFYERFFRATGTREAMEPGRVAFWSRPAASGEPSGPGPEYAVRPLRRSDEQLVCRAAERSFGPRTAASLSMVPGQLRLPETRRRFAAAGLSRQRRCRVVTRRGRPVAALLTEHLSPGLNLAWMLSGTWIVPIHADLGSDAEALRECLGAVARLEPPQPGVDRFAWLPFGVERRVAESAGWVCRMDLRTYVLNRAGLQRYFLYVADRYGAAQARAARLKKVKPVVPAKVAGGA